MYSKFSTSLWRTFSTSPSNWSSLSIITPTYFTLFDSTILSLSIFRTVFVNLLLVLNTIYSVFCLFTNNWDFAKKSISFEMLSSSFNFDNISSVSDVKRKLSSAYWTTVQSFSTIFAKSLTQILNNRGSKIVPCGTPLFKLIQSDSIPCRTPLWDLSLL